MKNWFKKISIILLILPLAGIVFVGRFVSKFFGKDKNPFKISEAEAQSSCWVPPSCSQCSGCGGSCAGCTDCV